MGKSRSTACVAAYLIWRYRINPTEALSQIRLARPICEPNQGFMEQLELFSEMAAPGDLEDCPKYQRWTYKREVALSNACGLAPDADKIRFEDEHGQETNRPEFELRCRKCRFVCDFHNIQRVLPVQRAFEKVGLFLSRHTLATSIFILKNNLSSIESDTESSHIQHGQSCAHIFVDALSWMRPELEQGKLDGRLECPKCQQNVGKYAWQGMRCNCGIWIVPAITLSKGRVDRTGSTSHLASIRHPPKLDASTTSTKRKNPQNL